MKSLYSKYFLSSLLGAGGVLLCVSVLEMTHSTNSSVGLPPLIDTANAETTGDGSPITKAPSWTLNDVEGHEVKSSDFEGKVRVVDFWATWCPPCREEIPNFIALQKKYSDKGLKVIGISMDQSSDPVASFIKSEGINYPIVMGNDEVSGQFGGAEIIPTTFIIDRSGKVVSVHTGYTDPAIIEDEVKHLL